MRTTSALLGLALLTSPALAEGLEDLAFDPSLVEDCLIAAEGRFDVARTCIGLAADGCMSGNGDLGGTTAGTSICLGMEFDWWDARLNDTYRRLMAQEKADDAMNSGTGLIAPEKAPALLTMQRAWIGWRDSYCEYEYSQWGGGTGGGPAHAGCMMTQTGEQSLRLEGFIWQD